MCTGMRIQPLDRLVPIESSGGADVPYLGHVEVRMQIPGISSFDQDVLMLISHTTTCYHRRVPVQVGSCIIDQVTSCIIEEELQSLFPILEIGICEYHNIKIIPGR